MNCPSCARSNRPGARFCGGCGASLAPRCPACGASNDPDARFCDACGGAIAAATASAEKAIARKVVTVVFADLIGSVSLHERLDAESARRVIDRYHRAMTAAVEVHGGRVVQLLGDGVLAAFGVPRVAEDDAIRAVRAGAGMQRAFRELVREQGAAMDAVGLRVAVNTGEVVVSDDETAVIGDPTNVAARLQQEARDGDVIVGEGTQRLVGDLVTLAPLGSFALRGRSESVAAFRLVSLDRPASARATAFVGRDDELRRLLAVYDAAVAAPGARLAVLLGSPGLGKSRLVAELERRAGERATVLAARCDAAGGATFAPIADALRAFLRIEEGAGGDVLRAAIDAVVPGDEFERRENGQRARDERSEAERARIASGIGALFSGAPSSPEETFFAVRRLLAALAAVRPVVLAIDDLHWAEPLLLDLVEHLVQWSAGVRLFLLVAARPELRDARSSLATPGPLVTDVVTLGGLDAGASMQLAAGVAGASELPAALVGRVLATSEGNPLFLSELVRMLVQDGTLVREGDRWVTTVEVSKLDMPPTIQVLLAARIERLRPEDRTVLERAAVIGRHFSRGAVAELLGRGGSDLDARLEALRRSELIEPDTGWFLGEPALRFHHILIRDAAYRRVLKETRAELHERFADWVVARAGESNEHDETIGWHLEQAHQNLRELGAIDAHGRSLGERAARHLGAAGRRALARDDLALAASLLGRAIERLERDDPARADLALDWCEALLAAGEVGPAAGAVAELGRLAAGSERLGAWHACFAGQLAALTDPQLLRATAGEVARAAAALADAGDAAGEAKAHSVHASALARLGEIGACETALDQALAAARRARDRRRSNAVLAGAPVAALWGPSPVTRASGRCLDVVRVLRITQGAPAVEAVALRCQAVLETLRGRTDAARRMIAASRAMVEELGIAQQLLEADVFAGLIELLQGDAEGAETPLRSAYEGLRARGLGIDAARAAALLGRALLAQGRAAEAEALSHESEALGGDDLKAAIAWRGVRAEALAGRGEHEAAIELARAAVAIASDTDALLDHADARKALAVALRAAGRVAEADVEERRTREIWETKGAALLVEQIPDADAAAVATELPSARPPRQRIRPNAATASAALVDAAVAARDFDAFLAALAPDAVQVHHPTGTVLTPAEARRGNERLVSGELERLHFHTEPIATLGERLALGRSEIAFASARVDAMTIGAADLTTIALFEVGPDGLRTNTEFFATDRLAEAVVRLYERDAALLPEGPERDAAATCARVVAQMLALSEFGQADEVVTENVVLVDHRVLGFGVAQGIEAVVAANRSLYEMADQISVRVDDVLALGRDGFLLRSTSQGVNRLGGGRFERPMLQIRIFGADGRMTRTEWFEADREAAALARFDELTRTDAPPVRRVRPNAATANVARLDAAMAARDAAALEAVFADRCDAFHHPLRASYGRAGAIESLRMALEDRELSFHHEPIATLGEALALSHQTLHAAGVVRDDLDVGAIETELLVLVEVDADGRRAGVEMFRATELAHAITRLYERHAERLPEGAERERATAITRAVSIGLTPGRSPEEWVSSDVAFHDRRRIGLGSVRGAAAMSRGAWSRIALASDLAIEVHDVLALGPRGFLVPWTTRGTQRDGGGSFANHYLMLRVFGDDGLARFVEWFDVDDAAAAIARFEELTAPSAAGRRIAPNAATACAAAIVRAVSARDLDGVAACVAETSTTLHHQSGASWGTEGALASWRMMIEGRDGRYGLDPIATLGDSLGLFLQSARASGLALDDPGDFELDHWLLFEVDGSGRMLHAELFAHDRLGDAWIRLYERHAELAPEGPERVRAATTARCVAGLFRREPSLVEAAAGGETEFQDHRRLGLLRSGRVSASDLASYRDSYDELTEDVSIQIDEILCVRPDAFLVRSTIRGRDRRSGGSFEQAKLDLRCFDAAGRLLRGEWFDVDREADAIARFAELTQEIPAPPIENAATRAAIAFAAAVRERGADALEDLLAPDMRWLSHESGIDMTRAETLTRMRAAIEHGRGLRTDLTPLAALGERLALHRRSSSAERIDDAELPVGAVEVHALTISEVRADGRLCRLEQFSESQAGRALVRLYELWAETAPEAERARAANVARAVAALSRPPDLDALAPLLAPDMECADHRMFGMGTASGASQYLSALRTLLDATQDLHNQDEILAADASTLVVRREGRGTLREGGGTFVQSMILLRAFGADGRITHIEIFDADRDADALARRAELVAGPSAEPFGNAAWRADLDSNRAWRERRWDDVVAAYHPDFELVDRRSMTGIDLRGSDFMRNLRLIFDTPGSEWHTELLATRGERHVLLRALLVAELRERGRVEWEHLGVFEFDAHGRRKSLVLFDTDHVDAAYAELEARYAAGEGAPHARLLATFAELARAWRAHDRAALERVAHESFTATGHRRFVRLDETRDRAGWIASCAALEEMGVDSAVRVDHLRISSRAALRAGAVQGTRDGGAFEIPVVFVYAHDGERLLSQDLYDGDQIDEAHARFAEIAAASTADPLARWLRPNAAVAAHARSDAAFHARDWPAMRASFAPDARIEERRAGLRTPPHDADTAVASLRDGAAAVPSLRVDQKLFATFGDRVALERQMWRGGAAGAEIEIEMLTLTEADAEGRIAALVSFDPSDVVAACREASERWIAIEPRFAPLVRAGLAYGEATRARDAAALRALLADDLVVEDRRRTGFGPLAGAEALVESFRAVWQLTQETASVVRARVAVEPWGSVLISHITGTLADGGAFEGLNGAITVFEDGRFRRLEFFELEDMEDALARFAALSREAVVPARIENLVTRVETSLQRAWDTRDWNAFVALNPPHLRSIDRRPLMHLEVDCAAMLTGLRPVFEMAEVERSSEVIATRGARLAMLRVRLRASDELAGPSEVDLLQVTETDADGVRIAAVAFGPDDFDACWHELEARYDAGEGGAFPGVAAAMRTFADAFARRDWEALAACCAPEIAVRDHRRLGWETLDGPAAYMRALRALVDLAPDTALRLDHVEMCERGYLVVTVWSGTRDGGAFEEPSLMVAELDAEGRILHFDQYELERLDQARARYAAIASPASRGSLRIPENAATRADLRWGALVAARDWDGLREHFAPDFVWEDRRRLFGASGGRDALLANVRLIADARFTVVDRQLLATNGDRLMLKRNVFRGGEPGAPVEVEMLQLIEVDGAGRIVAAVSFDTDDRRAAALEMFERFWANTEEGRRTTPAQIAFNRAIFAHDVAAMRAALPDGFRFDDYRRTGLGAGGGPDEFVAWMAAGMERSDDLAVETLGYLAIAEHGTLSVGRAFGRLRDGGEFESVVLRINRLDGDRWLGVEVFEPEDLERAKARFEEMGRSAATLAPNAAWRIWGRIAGIIAAGDWDALRALATPDFAFEDRQRRSLVRGDIETYVRNLAFVRSWPGRRVMPELLATAEEHLALDRINFVGDPSGGAFTGEFLRITELDANGRLRAVLHFDAEDLGAARAEMHERDARSGADSDLLRIPPNAATRAMDRFAEAALARDWDAFAAILAPAFTFEDRRRGIGMSGDRATMLASIRLVASSGVRWAGEVIATAGDRLALTRNRFWTADGATLLSEIETLQIAEVDAEGLVIAHVAFDASDLRAANLELVERYATSHPDESRRASRLAMARAMRDHDLDGVRAALHEGFVYHDHRRVGAGRLEGEEYVAWLAALFEQSPDAVIAPLYVIASEPHAVLSVGHTFGTRVEGGAFESVFVQISGAFGTELYDLDDLDRARARFEELAGERT